MKTYHPHISSVGGMSANLVAALCYVAVFVLGPIGFFAIIAVFFYEKKSGLVKFHAMQALLLCVSQSIINTIVSTIFGVIPRFGIFFIFSLIGQVGNFIAVTIIFLVFLLLHFLAAASSYRWNIGVIPLIGQIAQGICNASSRPAYTGDGPVPTHCQPQNGASCANSDPNPYANNNAYSSGEKSSNDSSTGPASRATSRQQNPTSSTKRHDPNSQLPESMRDNPRSDEMM